MNKNLFTYKKSGVNINAADKFVNFINKFRIKKFYHISRAGSGFEVAKKNFVSSKEKLPNKDLSLTKYPNVHFVGDALSARGISVSGAHGTLVAEKILDN